MARSPNHQASMSLQSQLELNDIPDFANEPGPGHYFGPESMGFSSMGQQRLSKHPSAPSVSLPRTGWDNWEKVRVSKTHSMAYLGRESPGATYNVTSGLSQKSTKIGTSKRPPLNIVDPNGSPGPAYNVREAIGEGVSEPPGRLKKGFGLASRFSTDKRGGIGPGQYARKDTALDLESGKSIGAGRAAWEKVITPGWETVGRCQASPGPGPPLWTDLKHDGSRSFSIGKADRFRSAKSDSPGPGAYRRDERDVSRCKKYLSDTPSPPQVAFGSRPKKPRFRQMLALHCSEHGAWGYF